MYANHNPLIAAGMRESSDIFLRGCLFTILSIRQPIINVPAALEDVLERGASSDSIWGHKRDAYAYLSTHAATLQAAILAAPDNAARFAVLLGVPGLGIVKAGFILQLMGYDVACLDARNVARERRNPRAFRTDGKAYGPAMARKVKRYLKITEGKAARYWDLWCADVARVYKRTPDEISALHLAIVPDNYIPF